MSIVPPVYPPCRLCGISPADCRSHIIPKQFWKRVRKEAKHLLKMDMSVPDEMSFTQSGIWEQGHLCRECDRKLGIFDEYAYDVLPSVPEPVRYQKLRKDVSVYSLGKVDVDRFRMFLAALVWRTGIARDPLFRRVRLGPYENRLRDALNGKDRDTLDSITAVICLYQPPTFDSIVWPPFPRSVDGIKAIQFYLYPWKLMVKLDRQSFRPPFQDLVFTRLNPALALVLDRHSKGEIDALRFVHKQLRQSHDA